MLIAAKCERRLDRFVSHQCILACLCLYTHSAVFLVSTCTE